MRFLFTRRWLIFAIVVALLAWLAVELGDWQFRRLKERAAANSQLAANLAAAPLPVRELLTPGRPPKSTDEWRLATATGTWDNDHTVVVRYRTRDGRPGVDVVTPLRTAHGTVLVDRGWLGSENTSARPTVPPGREGLVSVTGFVRLDATGSSAKVTELSTRAISSVEIAKALPYDDLMGGFLNLKTQTPVADDGLAALELPVQTEGPHFFYGLQWWFFGALAIFGFGYLVWDERRRLRLARSAKSD